MIYDAIIDLFKILVGSVELLKPFAVPFGILVLLLKQNNIRKMVNGNLPKRFRDTHEADIQEIRNNVRDIKRHLEVPEWSSLQQNGHETIPTLSYKRFFLLLRKANIRRRKVFMEKLKSRKFWLTILAALIPVINEEFGIDLDLGHLIAIMSTIMAGVGFIAHVDAKKILASIMHTKITAANVELAFTTFQEAIPYLKGIHADINQLLEDVKKDNTTEAFKDAMRAYTQIKAILDNIKHPDPVPTIPDAPNEKVVA